MKLPPITNRCTTYRYSSSDLEFSQHIFTKAASSPPRTHQPQPDLLCLYGRSPQECLGKHLYKPESSSNDCLHCWRLVPRRADCLHFRSTQWAWACTPCGTAPI